MADLLSVVEETLTGLRIVKGFNAEEKMKAQFAESNERYAKVFKRVTRKAYLASPISEFLATIVVMILMYVGGNLALHGDGNMTPEKLIALPYSIFPDNSACKEYHNSLFQYSERYGLN